MVCRCHENAISISSAQRTALSNAIACIWLSVWGVEQGECLDDLGSGSSDTLRGSGGGGAFIIKEPGNFSR